MDWPERMADVIDEYRGRAFSDSCYCLTFAGAVVEAMTGEDALGDWAGLTLDEALDRLAAAGLTLPGELRARLGDPVLPSRAHRGDVVVLEQADGTSALGICIGAQAAFLSDEGLAFKPMADVRLVYRVPF